MPRYSVFEALEDWGAGNESWQMCFAHTQSQPGAINGAYHLATEDGPPPRFICFPSSRPELALWSLSTCLGSSSGPEINHLLSLQGLLVLHQPVSNKPSHQTKSAGKLGHPSGTTTKVNLEGLLHHSEPPFLVLERRSHGLSLFDSRSRAPKTSNCKAILYDEGAEEPTKRINLPSSTSSCGNTALLCHKNSLRLSKALDIKDRLPVRQPSGNGRKRNRKVEDCRRIEGLRVVNDTAERGVALISPSTPADQRRGKSAIPPPSWEAHRHQQPGTSKASLPPGPNRPQ
ncbi:hypothetical protein GWK47_036617 [Chionoecetes opilio]|uniref:Uncharacterized protein n=1 Tax=Chionoecetes opilio TaxID=41210 RepID=A0A8J5D1S4_CHIOP|nr:hypothetical protein GWK47_036617 [Chionoecetes opilio]